MLQRKQKEKRELLFTGRSNYLKQIRDAVSKNNITAVLGSSGFGRSEILRHLAAENNYFFIDAKRLSLSPESFAVDFIGGIYALEKGEKQAIKYQSIEVLKSSNLQGKSQEIVAAINNELQKIKPDQKLVMQKAFSFAEAFFADKKKKTAIIINNADEILKLNNFQQIGNVIAQFQSIVKDNSYCSFILSSGFVNLMKTELKKKAIASIEITNFSKEETSELFSKIAGRSDERVIAEVYRLSTGIPTIVKCIAERFSKEKNNDVQKDIQLVSDILMQELSDRKSTTYFYCSRLLSESLNRARGDSLLKTILKAVSQNRPLRLTEVSKLIYRSAPVTKSLLERLVEVDIIVKNDNTFDFANQILKMWCRIFFSTANEDDSDDLSQMFGGML